MEKTPTTDAEKKIYEQVFEHYFSKPENIGSLREGGDLNDPTVQRILAKADAKAAAEPKTITIHSTPGPEDL
jgi:hypothetical protein